MHELAVCQALIDAVTQIAAENHARIVSDIHVSVGPLSGVESTLMEDAFPIAAAGTAASGAVLHLHTQAVRVRCKECGAESEVAPNRLVCALCDNWRTRLISGDELMLERVCLHETNTLKDNEGTGTHV